MSLRIGCRQICFLNNLNSITRPLGGKNASIVRFPNVSPLTTIIQKIHSSCIHWDLMEFFDDEKNWGVREIRVGRSWKIEELRIKSNSDLHKLWYVLLKEKNMLLTMEHECKTKFVAFPNPERIDKVDESMENLEKVVRERNTAYYLLETGETGERPIEEGTNCFGLPYKRKMVEHLIEKKYNKKFQENHKLNNVTDDHKFVNEFLMKLEEKKQKRIHAIRRRHFEKVCELLKRFPNVDEEALKEEYPDLDIEECKRDPRSRTHGINAF